MYTEVNAKQNDNDTSFQNDPTWKWFKDDNIDILESSSKWYQIMDLHIQCKGRSKPTNNGVKKSMMLSINLGRKDISKN